VISPPRRDLDGKLAQNHSSLVVARGIDPLIGVEESLVKGVHSLRDLLTVVLLE
jgi:hypothetical protein